MNHPEPVWDAARGNRSLIAATVLVVVVALFVPSARVFSAVAWILVFISWVLGRSVVYVRDRQDQAGCRCCREGYPVIWVEPRLLLHGYPVRSKFDPEIHLCQRHESRWFRIMKLEREVLSIEALIFPWGG